MNFCVPDVQQHQHGGTWQELNGEDAVPNEELAKKKSICTSRSFNGMISDKDTLRAHIANYAARCAEKLRMQNTVATTVGVFVNTNAFREDLAQYWNFQETRLVTPTSSTIPIVQAAHDVFDRIFIQGYQYKKALGRRNQAPLRNLSHDYLLHAFGESHVSADALCSQLGIIAVEADKHGVWELCGHLLEGETDDDGSVETYTKLQ